MSLARLFVAALAFQVTAPLALAAQPVRDSAAPLRRERLERQLRQGIWRVAKARVNLTDDQMRKLEATTGKFDARRHALNVTEREQRQALRAELAAGDRANQERVAAALDRLLSLQRQRLDIVAEEQRDLASFMTPVQRARYSALQDQLRRRVEMMRRGRLAPARPVPHSPGG